jgi:hypothetical protein
MHLTWVQQFRGAVEDVQVRWPAAFWAIPEENVQAAAILEDWHGSRFVEMIASRPLLVTAGTNFYPKSRGAAGERRTFQVL